jgi:hypothetical protein
MGSMVVSSFESLTDLDKYSPHISEVRTIGSGAEMVAALVLIELVTWGGAFRSGSADECDRPMRNHRDPISEAD